MKRLAARDLENLLQVRQIVSDNETSLTFPVHNSSIRWPPA